MLCVVVLEVEDGDFSDLKGSALNVHSSVIVVLGLTEHKGATRNGDFNNHITDHHLQNDQRIDCMELCPSALPTVH